jgi:hypothetical protein
LVGIVFAAVEVRGELRTTFDAGTTDEARRVDLAELDGLPHVEPVDFVAGLLA